MGTGSRHNDFPGRCRALLPPVLLAGAMMLSAIPASALSGIRVLADSVLMPADSLKFSLPPEGFSIEICGRLTPGRQRSSAQWSLRLADGEGRQEGGVTVSSDETLPGDFDAGRRVSAQVAGRAGERLAADEICGNPGQTDGFFTVSVSVADGFAEYWAGNESYRSLGTFRVGDISEGVLRTTVPLEIKSVNIRGEAREPWQTGRRPEVRDTSAVDRMAPPCGIYRYLDYETETRRALRGGDYRLGVLPAPEGGYDLLYLSGADHNADNWEAGMVKGHLAPTVFVNHYDLTWTDASFRTDIAGAWGEFSGDGALMILYFPTEKAVLRFSFEGAGH